MEEEIWKDIEGYEGLYQVSNLGRVRSLDRSVVNKLGRKFFYKGQIIKHCYTEDGYAMVSLSDKNKIRKTHRVHRLVAQAFLPNPKNKPQIDHKNRIRDDNRLENLRWVTYHENNMNQKEYEHKGSCNPKKPIVGINISTGKLSIYTSFTRASKITNTDQGQISRCCMGIGSKAKGRKWFYLKRYKNNVKLKSK